MSFHLARDFEFSEGAERQLNCFDNWLMGKGSVAGKARKLANTVGMAPHILPGSRKVCNG